MGSSALPHSSKIILITGCSSGFGLLTAARLSAKGHRVVATMRDLAKQEPLRQEVKKRGGEVTVLALDVTDPDSIECAVRETGNRFGYIDVLINNAGFGIGGFFEDLSDEEIRRQFETNFFGVLNVTRAVIPFMRQRRRGKIINISSVAGFSSSPALGAYNASKWALEGFSESLRYELKFFGIDVLLIEPGTYKTKIFYENAQYAENFDNEQSPYFPMSQHMRNLMNAHIDDCFKDPEDIALLTERLIEAKRPAFRSIPDLESRARYWLRRLLPFSVNYWLTTKILFGKFDRRKLGSPSPGKMRV